MNDTPEHVTKAMRQRLQDMEGDLRRDLGRLDDPRLRVLFETAAEVVLGLTKAFAASETKAEPAWRTLSRRILP